MPTPSLSIEHLKRQDYSFHLYEHQISGSAWHDTRDTHSFQIIIYYKKREGGPEIKLVTLTPMTRLLKAILECLCKIIFDLSLKWVTTSSIHISYKRISRWCIQKIKPAYFPLSSVYQSFISFIPILKLKYRVSRHHNYLL